MPDLTADFDLPAYLTRGADTALQCVVRKSGTAVAPDSGTLTVYDQTGDTVWSGAVTVTGTTSSATVPAASVPSTLSFSDRWRVVWSLVFGADTVDFSNSAGLVRSVFRPVVSDADLYRRREVLRPDPEKAAHDFSSFEDQIREAWLDIHGRLLRRGPIPNLIVEPTSLREPHILLSLSLVFEVLSSMDARWMEEADRYRQRFEDAFASLSFQYDEDEDGTADGTRSARPPVWLTARW